MLNVNKASISVLRDGLELKLRLRLCTGFTVLVYEVEVLSDVLNGFHSLGNFTFHCDVPVIDHLVGLMGWTKELLFS